LGLPALEPILIVDAPRDELTDRPETEGLKVSERVAHAEAVEAVSEILSRVGYNGIAVEVPLERGIGADHTVKAYVVEDADAFAKVSDVRDALGHLQAFGLGPIGELVARRVDDKDWLESWKAQFVPIRCGSFLVRPSWSEAVAGDAVELVLDPGMAFGTGLRCRNGLRHPRDRRGETWRLPGRRSRHRHARGRRRT
jgi:ribosomal protein L11 methylase PrmA